MNELKILMVQQAQLAAWLTKLTQRQCQLEQHIEKLGETVKVQNEVIARLIEQIA
jgi:cell division protein FtsB